MFRILLLSVLVAGTPNDAQPECESDFCNLVDCMPLTPEICSAQGKEFREHSSQCGCCHQCLDYLSEGSLCTEESLLHAHAPALHHHRCKPGTVCRDNVCSRVFTQGHTTQ